MNRRCLSLRRTVGTLLILVTGLVPPLFGLGVAQGAEEPTGRWALRVEDDRHRVIVEATLRLTTHEGRSCRGGHWRRVEVESSRQPNPGRFPIDEPLTWTVQDGQLLIGRNGICDAYLSLSGNWPANPSVQGSFYSLGHSGAKDLGSFTMTRP